jgi:hypothetical protein
MKTGRKKTRGRARAQDTGLKKKKKVNNIPAGVAEAALMASPTVSTLRSPSVAARKNTPVNFMDVPVT